MTLLVISSPSFSAATMNQAILEKTVKSIASYSKGEKGVVEFRYKKVNMFLVSDVAHDRVRIIAPVIKFDKLTKKQITAVLESNFHKSLDARYAVSGGVLYSAYIHPLSALSKQQIRSAVLQVANLLISFGNEYSSGLLIFGGKKPINKEIIPNGTI